MIAGSNFDLTAFVQNICKNVVKIYCMLEINAVVQKCRVVSGTRGVTNVMNIFGRAPNLPRQKRLRVAMW